MVMAGLVPAIPIIGAPPCHIIKPGDDLPRRENGNADLCIRGRFESGDEGGIVVSFPDVPEAIT
jgi:hypothetical protein